MEFNPSSNALLQLAPILIQVACAIHTHTQFKMIGKQSNGNDCPS